MPTDTATDLLRRDDHDEPSVFLPENLLREARRQRKLPEGPVPEICLLDPDGDIARHLASAPGGARSPSWACYHTDLWETDVHGRRIGVVGNAVGAPFAVLVAEELFASGCRLLVSVTSAGRVAEELPVPARILITRALRGEGTSGAYLPPAPAIDADPQRMEQVGTALDRSGLPVIRGVTWTTDAPFRETESAIASAARQGALAVEMEAAALYAFAATSGNPVVCFAHVTNSMAVDGDDFEKGPTNGVDEALRIAAVTASALLDRD